MTALALKATDVCSGYGQVPVLHNLNLEVKAGEIVALVGPNGSGKTTTLLTFAGLVRSTRGTVEIGGLDVTNMPTHRIAREGLSMVADDRCLLSSLTVAESLALLPERRIEPMEVFPELHELANRRCGLLSGGQQQMVGVARALAPAPRLLLLEELSQGLAPLVVDRLMDAVRQAADQHAIGVVVVEQHVKRVLEIADRGCVLVKGTVDIDKPAAQLLLDREQLEASYLGGVAAESV